MSGGVKEGKLATPEATDAHPLLRMAGRGPTLPKKEVFCT